MKLSNSVEGGARKSVGDLCWCLQCGCRRERERGEERERDERGEREREREREYWSLVCLFVFMPLIPCVIK